MKTLNVLGMNSENPNLISIASGSSEKALHRLKLVAILSISFACLWSSISFAGATGKLSRFVIASERGAPFGLHMDELFQETRGLEKNELGKLVRVSHMDPASKHLRFDSSEFSRRANPNWQISKRPEMGENHILISKRSDNSAAAILERTEGGALASLRIQANLPGNSPQIWLTLHRDLQTKKWILTRNNLGFKYEFRIDQNSNVHNFIYNEDGGIGYLTAVDRQSRPIFSEAFDLLPTRTQLGSKGARMNAGTN